MKDKKKNRSSQGAKLELSYFFENINYFKIQITCN